MVVYSHIPRPRSHWDCSLHSSSNVVISVTFPAVVMFRNKPFGSQLYFRDIIPRPLQVVTFYKHSSWQPGAKFPKPYRLWHSRRRGTDDCNFGSCFESLVWYFVIPGISGLQSLALFMTFSLATPATGWTTPPTPWHSYRKPIGATGHYTPMSLQRESQQLYDPILKGAF